MDLPAEVGVWIGRESAPVQAPGPIEWSEVRRYVNATEDSNPLWATGGPDQTPGRVGALVPPMMILDVLRPPVGVDTTRETGERGFPATGGFASLISVPNEVSRLNAGTDIEWVRPLRIGDWITVRFKILDIVSKATKSGPALFITEERKCFDRDGELVAVIRQTTVRTLAKSPRA